MGTANDRAAMTPEEISAYRAQKAAEHKARWAARDAAAERKRVMKAVAKYVLALHRGEPQGACCYCGKRLTDDVSRNRGFGPDCWTKVEREVAIEMGWEAA